MHLTDNFFPIYYFTSLNFYALPVQLFSHSLDFLFDFFFFFLPPNRFSFLLLFISFDKVIVIGFLDFIVLRDFRTPCLFLSSSLAAFCASIRILDSSFRFSILSRIVSRLIFCFAEKSDFLCFTSTSDLGNSILISRLMKAVYRLSARSLMKYSQMLR